MSIQILKGDCVEIMKSLAAGSVHTCVTSPPYWGLRDYGMAGQLGLEATPEEYVAKMVEVFREVKRVLRDDGTLWLNLGDSYVGAMSEHKEAGSFGKNSCIAKKTQSGVPTGGRIERGRALCEVGLKSKDLVGIPWMVAFALRTNGWYLRADIIWHKPNPMPESVTDRPTKAHEYIFLLTKEPSYYYDHEAIKEATVRPGETQTFGGQKGRDYKPKPGDPNFRNGKEQWGRDFTGGDTRNKRSVWTVSTKPFSGAHFATFPTDLIEPCIKAGAPVGGTVLDPFGGAGTTGLVSDRLGRHAILCELNPEYVKIAKKRLHDDSPLFSEVKQ